MGQRYYERAGYKTNQGKFQMGDECRAMIDGQSEPWQTPSVGSNPEEWDLQFSVIASREMRSGEKVG